MKSLIFGAITCVSLVAFSQEAQPAQSKKIDRARLNAAIYNRTGGKIKEPDVQQGKVVYINCQNAISTELIKAHAEFFAETLKIEIEVVDGTFSLSKPAVQGDLSLFVIDQDDMPMSLVSPESKWAMVNVAPLKTDKKVFFENRTKKMLTRGFSYLCGAAVSQYPQSLLSCVTKPQQLDKFTDDKLPVDVMQRFENYLPGCGVVPYKLVTYRKACQEGWAPQPTNDVQRVIWEEYHTKPTEPIKIKYDPEKGI